MVQLSLGTRNICSSKSPVDHGTHSASSLKGRDSSVSEGQVANGVKVNTQLWPLPRLGMNGAIPLLASHSLAGTEVTSTVSGRQLNMQRNYFDKFQAPWNLIGHYKYDTSVWQWLDPHEGNLKFKFFIASNGNIDYLLCNYDKI